MQVPGILEVYDRLVLIAILLSEKGGNPGTVASTRFELFGLRQRSQRSYSYYFVVLLLLSLSP